MKYLFLAYTIASFIGGCAGASHQFGISAICLLITLILWYEHKKKKQAGNKLTD